MRDFDFFLYESFQTAAILSREQDFPIRVETDLYQWVANKNYTYETDEKEPRRHIRYLWSKMAKH